MLQTNLNPELAGELTRRLEPIAARLVILDTSSDLPAEIAEQAQAIRALLEQSGSFVESRRLLECARTAGDLAGALQQLQDQVSQTPSSASYQLSRDPELVSDFLLESKEYLSSIETTLLRLEANPSDAEAIHNMFRAFHTIKGLAGFLEYAAIQQTAHEVESALDLARSGKLAICARTVNVILAAKDYLSASMASIEKAGGESPLDSELLSRIQWLSMPGGSDEPSADLAMLSKVAAERENLPGVAVPQAPIVAATHGRETRSVKVDTNKLDALVDMVGEMVIAQSLIRHDPDLVSLDRPRLSRNITQLARITDEVQKTAMSMRMVPVRGLFQKMSRLVRDLGLKSGKRVALRTEGDDTELDRHIVEELADPMMHMVRNAVDHGIEPGLERQAGGKRDEGRIDLRARHQSGRILIEIADDGRGLNYEKILAKAHSLGLIGEGERPAEADVFNLIFHPGFSTAETVTDVSGRGVGMDVVRKQIMKLRGRVEIQSVSGAGTTFSIKLPLTLAIIDGLVVAGGREKFIVPLGMVREVLQLRPDMLFTVEGRNEMVLARGHLLPMVRLCRHFGIEPRSENAADGVVVVVEGDSRRYCLLVDELVGKQEVVIKALGDLFKSVRGLAGGAILGDGRIGLVLDAEAIGGETGLG